MRAPCASRNPKVKLHVRGQVVVRSESKKLTSRLMAAFASPEGVDSGFPVHGVLIPSGYEKGRYSALAQMHVPGLPLSNTNWDLGLSLVAGGQVLDEASGRLNVAGPGLPVVLEVEMSFEPGPYRVVLVAHEVSGDQIGTTEVEGEWPDPNKVQRSYLFLPIKYQKKYLYLHPPYRLTM